MSRWYIILFHFTNQIKIIINKKMIYINSFLKPNTSCGAEEWAVKCWAHGPRPDGNGARTWRLPTPEYDGVTWWPSVLLGDFSFFLLLIWLYFILFSIFCFFVCFISWDVRIFWFQFYFSLFLIELIILCLTLFLCYEMFLQYLLYVSMVYFDLFM